MLVSAEKATELMGTAAYNDLGGTRTGLTVSIIKIQLVFLWNVNIESERSPNNGSRESIQVATSRRGEWS